MGLLPKSEDIAPDQFLAYLRKPDGSPLEPYLTNNFVSLAYDRRLALGLD